MSPSLVADVAARTQARWLEAVPLLRGLPPSLIVDLASSLGTRSFSPDEVRTLACVRLRWHLMRATAQFPQCCSSGIYLWARLLPSAGSTLLPCMHLLVT